MAAMRARNKIRVPRRGLTNTRGDDFDSLWIALKKALNEINTKNASTLSFEELYRNAYRITLMQRANDLYENVKELEGKWLQDTVQKHITDTISTSLIRSQGPSELQDQSNERRADGERFLSAMKEKWEDHQVCMGMVTDVLMYMDRVISADKSKPGIYSVAMALFRDHILRAFARTDSDISIYNVLESTILFMIQLERNGHMIERPLVRQCIQMLEGLYDSVSEDENTKLYLVSFEPQFLKESTEFYQAEGRRLLEIGDASAFCRIASQRIAEERERCLYTLALSTESKVLQTLDEELILKNIDEVARLEGTGVRHMLDNNQLDGLLSLYKINARVDPKKTALVNVMNKRIIDLGKEINAAALTAAQGQALSGKKIEEEKKPEDGKKPEKSKEKQSSQQTLSAIKWVDDILAMKRQFDQIWEHAFMSDQGVQSAIMASFADFININPRSSEYLSLFFDENLRKGIKDKTDTEIDTLLDNGITMLRYIKDKDLFEAYYKKHLARRLLMKRSASMDAERQMISKMKLEVGNQFTQRIEHMFKDMTISEDLTASYKAHIAQSADPDQKRVELDVDILTSTMWPLESMSNTDPGDAQKPCLFPKEIDNLKESFERYYLGKHNGRKLTWLANMGTVDIRATFQRSNGKIQRYELNVSTYGMAILSLFNDLPDGESYTFEEIQGRTQIPSYDLIRNLQSLAVAPKTRILVKKPMSKDVKRTDRFFVNNEFSNPFVKVKIGVVSGGANKAENPTQRKETEGKINEERGSTIEAAIVRIMKQRKKSVHSQLIAEVLAQLASRFVPDVMMVKRRIESLIERDYLERIAEEPPTYGYVA
ncbi:hypothetical protein N7532_003179 [Penicillium argentinense]|uniref:Cullin family profile domain-containing protein n=1 Tax=Penicillium argentinense TaxID=1131581 RepID=A0A9W9FMI8_9EURO|nr:uncharacterized protein N7532_003179 [Penicillium argentinense]KAJ5102650.1 hypothetical protein N7532_003179 [Penicillium argentinense]